MKRKYINTILACSIVVSLAACTDVWNEHYQSDSALNGNESLWELISNDPELDDFEQLLQATGYDEVLTQKRSFTVWAPINLSDLVDVASLSTANDSLLEVYRKEIVENHIADYSQVAGGIRDKEDKKNYKRVVVLNGKSYHFEGSVSNAYSFAGQQLRSSNVVANNGVLHKLDRGVLFSANIWEQLAKEPSVRKLYNFLNKDTKIEFDAANSVIGPIVDGKQTYLDSIFTMSNRWVDNSFFATKWGLGNINCEDSTYTMYALTDDAWDELYHTMRDYYIYPQLSAKDELGGEPLNVVADSLVREMICENLVFSNTVNKKFFDAERDTLISTRYNEFTGDVAHALHDGCLKELELSNGTLHIIDQVNFKPLTCWHDTVRIEGESLGTAPTSRKDPKFENATVSSKDFERGDSLYDSMSRHKVGIFKSTDNTSSSSQPTLRFYADGLLSAYYRISIVILPSYMVDPADTIFVKPNKFKASLNYCQSDGTYTKHNFTSQNKDKNVFISDPTKVDTIVLADAYKMEVSQYMYEYWLDTPQTYVEIKTDISFGVRGENNTKYVRDPDNWKYDNYYRIDQVIFEPIPDPTVESEK